MNTAREIVQEIIGAGGELWFEGDRVRGATSPAAWRFWSKQMRVAFWPRCYRHRHPITTLSRSV